MDPIDVPEVYVLPKLENGSENPVELANLVLTCLLTHQSAVLYAEYSPPETTVTWYIRSRGEKTMQQRDIPVAISSSTGYFRSTLARFGHHYMNGQLYGGFTRLRLRQGSRIHSSTIFMSNTSGSDFWIRIYATAEPETLTG